MAKLIEGEKQVALVLSLHEARLLAAIAMHIAGPGKNRSMVEKALGELRESKALFYSPQDYVYFQGSVIDRLTNASYRGIAFKDDE